MNCVKNVSSHPPPGRSKGMFGVVAEGPEAAEKFYNEWVAEVKNSKFYLKCITRFRTKWHMYLNIGIYNHNVHS